MIGNIVNFMDGIKIKILHYANSYQVISTIILYFLFMLIGAGESISALLAFILPIYAKIRTDNDNEMINIIPNLIVIFGIFLIQVLIYLFTGFHHIYY